jgi:hypothetical protein
MLGPIIAENDRILDAFGMTTDTAQREQIVPIETGMGDLHPHPTLRNVWFRPLADL